MDCGESGMKIAKSNDEESEAKKRINKILRQVTKLQEMKPAAKKHAARISMILEQVNKLEEEMIHEEKVEQAKIRIRQMYSGGTNVTYDRDTTTCYPPDRMQRLICYAQMAIDVFNQRQPIKYSVVEVLRATTRLVTGFIVHLKFTAKPDDDGDDDDAKTFAASVYCGIERDEVTYVELSSSYRYDYMSKQPEQKSEANKAGNPGSEWSAIEKIASTLVLFLRRELIKTLKCPSI